MISDVIAITCGWFDWIGMMVGLGWWDEDDGMRMVGMGWWDEDGGMRMVGLGWWDEDGVIRK